MYQVYNNNFNTRAAYSPTHVLGTHNNENNYNLRCMNKFSHVQNHSELGRNCARYRGPIVWNSIPKLVLYATSLQRFKGKLKLVSRTLDQNIIWERSLFNLIKRSRHNYLFKIKRLTVSVITVKFHFNTVMFLGYLYPWAKEICKFRIKKCSDQHVKNVTFDMKYFNVHFEKLNFSTRLSFIRKHVQWTYKILVHDKTYMYPVTK